jgi:hypothetical protein
LFGGSRRGRLRRGAAASQRLDRDRHEAPSVAEAGDDLGVRPRFWIWTTSRFVTEGLSPLRLITLGALILRTGQIELALTDVRASGADAGLAGFVRRARIRRPSRPLRCLRGCEQAPVERIAVPASWH